MSLTAKLGLIVNPIAGMGGRVGLKGTDGDALDRARALGAKPEAPRRAGLALETVRRKGADDIEILTAAGEMGEDSARDAGLAVTIVAEPQGNETSADDTRAVGRELKTHGVDLVVFVGGDGTARDIMDSIGTCTPVIGIPAGVKMHSAVFATDPRSGGELISRFLRGDIERTREAEVMDIDEEAFREGRLSARLYGHVMTPYDPALIQDLKMGSAADEDALMDAIAQRVVDAMDPETLYIIGPGTTTRRILERMDLPATLLGVDLVKANKVLASDANEREILDCLDESPSARIIVTPIGGQGYLFGRGNQQISARVIERVGGKEAITIVAAKSKLLALGRRPLLVDTGDPGVDESLRGYVPVIVDYREDSVRKIR